MKYIFSVRRHYSLHGSSGTCRIFNRTIVVQCPSMHPDETGPKYERNGPKHMVNYSPKSAAFSFRPDTHVSSPSSSLLLPATPSPATPSPSTPPPVTGITPAPTLAPTTGGERERHLYQFPFRLYAYTVELIGCMHRIWTWEMLRLVACAPGVNERFG